jgi:NAD(P)-dependent dehydrogenase (short-subunit alcohol dehydrogenase family)
MAKTKTAIVIGVGALNGLGASIARRLAREGLHVLLAGRSAGRLEGIAAAIANEGGSAEAVVADATDELAVANLFATAKLRGALELAVFNAGNNTPGRIAEMEASYFEASWRTGCFGGFLFAREAARQMLPAGGTLIFTGASASLRGRAGFGAFNAAKGALRLLAQALAKECGPEGLHVAHVIIDGGIDGEVLRKRLPEMVERLGKDRLIDLDGLAAAYWFLHQQPRRAWTFELDLRTKDEAW